MVTLEIPPYRFKRKTDAKEIGKRAYFECNSCDKLDEKTSAHAIKHEDENGEIFYELVSWPRNHECAPSAQVIWPEFSKIAVMLLLQLTQ